jgi:diguanylate cyclase (GGDEF)-like protein
MERLLIVDDEPGILKMCKRVFRNSGYNVQYASSGEEALRKASDFKPDVILLDIVMPGIDGFEVCRQLKAKAETKEAEVVFISGKGERPNRLKGYKARASDFLVKPINPEELRAKLAVIFNRQRYYKDLASIDDLTKLGNRKFFNANFDDIYQIAGKYCKSFSLAALDIDHFKNINDTYGHPVGDFVLKELARWLKENIRSTDIPARTGGEEFAILLPETQKISAIQDLERLREEIASKSFVKPGEKNPLKITISVGVASFPEDSSDKEELYKKADDALYLAKQKGRNRVEPAISKTNE